MQEVTLEEAGNKLPQLVEAANRGEEVVITRDNIAVAKLVAIPVEKPRRMLGTAAGRVRIADDFDAPLDDFKDYT